jgi:hypothetical protein
MLIESTSKPLSGICRIDDNIVRELMRFVKYGLVTNMQRCTTTHETPSILL